jgi:hypothetical protein
MVDNPDGSFVVREMQTAEVSPIELLQKHIDMVSQKIIVLALINEFIAMIHQERAASSGLLLNAQEARTLTSEIEQALTSLKDRFVSLRGVLQRVRSDLERVKQQPSSSPQWRFEALESLPEEIRRHRSVLAMQDLIEDYKQRRIRLERAKERLLSYSRTSHRSTVQGTAEPYSLIRTAQQASELALRAVEELETLDPEDDFRVRGSQTGGLGGNELRLQWQDRTFAWSRLPEIRRALTEIRDEQNAINNLFQSIEQQVQNLIGPILDDKELWRQVNTRTDKDSQVLAMWDKMVQAGNRKALHLLLGTSQLAELETTRRKGFLARIGTDNVPDRADHLLPESTNRQAPAIDPNTEGLTMVFTMWKRVTDAWGNWSLANLFYVVAHLRKLVEYAASRDNLNSLGRPVTFSEESQLMLEQLAQFQDRLSVLVEVAKDYKDNCEYWAREQEQLVRIRIPRAVGSARAALIRRLSDICPDFPYESVDYEPQRPPLKRAGDW